MHTDADLRGALLTDRELAAGGNAWRDLPDPSGFRHTDPCEPGADVAAGPVREDAEHR